MIVTHIFLTLRREGDVPARHVAAGMAAFFLGAFLFSASAFANARYAVLIGQNHGRGNEPRLKFAENDVAKIRGALVRVGDFEPGKTVMFQGGTRDSARQAIVDVNARIRQGPDEQSVLFVFYSGHADANALHFGDEDFDFEELKDLVLGSPAALRILVVDACRSGVLTERKGGSAAPAFDLVIEAPGDAPEGFVVLTAASAGEDAQESPELQGGFFTHHFVSGLLGAADKDEDGRVTLEEVTGHAYANTVRQTSETVVGTQHPSFAYDVRGTGKVVLSTIANQATMGQVELPAGFRWLIFRGAGEVTAELPSSSVARRILLAEGEYTLVGRGPSSVYETNLVVRQGEKQAPLLQSMKQTAFSKLVRKGGVRVFSNAVSAGGFSHTALFEGQPPCGGARLSYEATFQYLSVIAGGSVCLSQWKNDVLTASERELSLDVGLAHVFDLPVVSLSVGGGVGGALWSQEFGTNGVAPHRFSSAPFFHLTAGAVVGILPGLFLRADVIGRSYLLLKQGDALSLSTPVVLGGQVGGGWEF